MDHSKSLQSALPQNLVNLLQLMQEGLIVLDPSGIVVFSYQAAGKLFGVTDHNDLLGKHFSELY
jgi:PAS domain-containing protein